MHKADVQLAGVSKSLDKWILKAAPANFRGIDIRSVQLQWLADCELRPGSAPNVDARKRPSNPIKSQSVFDNIANKAIKSLGQRNRPAWVASLLWTRRTKQKIWREVRAALDISKSCKELGLIVMCSMQLPLGRQRRDIISTWCAWTSNWKRPQRPTPLREACAWSAPENAVSMLLQYRTDLGRNSKAESCSAVRASQGRGGLES